LYASRGAKGTKPARWRGTGGGQIDQRDVIAGFPSISGPPL